MYKCGMILLKGLLNCPANPREVKFLILKFKGLSWLKRAAEKADANSCHSLHELALLFEKPSEITLAAGIHPVFFAMLIL
jgi:TPR repeat protein